MQRITSTIRNILTWLLYTTLATPLLVIHGTLQPFIFGKAIYFRGLVEIILVLFIITLVSDQQFYADIKQKVKTLIRTPLFLGVVLFLVSLSLSTFFAENIFHAFWGDIQRSEGLFGLLHFFIFFLLSSLIFTKKHWHIFFKIAVVVSGVLIIYGLFQALGIKGIPFAINPTPRIESFIGNPSFFASFLFFSILSAALVWFQAKHKAWKFMSGLVGLGAVVSIFLTNTRGAVVGIAGGLLFLFIYGAFSRWANTFSIKGVSFRKISIALLLLLLICSAVFITTRKAAVWEHIPGLNRLADTEASSIDDPSVQTRLITWSISWEAFLEKPIFGWGPENYITAYSNHYDPDYALYGETWLDRAHNKFFDLLVMQGLVGLITYLCMLVALFYSIFKFFPRVAPVLTAIVVGYIVQNIFVFDTITTYLMLFAVLGFVVSRVFQEDSDIQQSKPNFVVVLASLLLVMLVGYVFVTNVYVPVVQAQVVEKIKNIDPAEEDKVINIISPLISTHHFATQELFLYVFDYYYDKMSQIFEAEEYSTLADNLWEQLDVFIDQAPSYDPRLYIRKTETLNLKARTDESAYEPAQEAMRRALTIAPNRQELYYHLAFTLGGQGRYEEAIQVAQEAINLSPGVAHSHYYLGLIYSFKGDKEAALAEIEKAREFSPELTGFFSEDMKSIALIYETFSQQEKLAHFVLGIARGDFKVGTVSMEKRYFDTALYYFLTNHDRDNLIELASIIGNNIPPVKGDMDVIIDLASKEKWDILESLIEIQSVPATVEIIE